MARISCSLFFLAPIVSECVKAEKGREGEMGRTEEVTRRQSRLLLCFGRHLASPDGRTEDGDSTSPVTPRQGPD